ncbi:MAG: vWA domain-containing protein [Myxococcota bacterium]
MSCRSFAPSSPFASRSRLTLAACALATLTLACGDDSSNPADTDAAATMGGPDTDGNESADETAGAAGPLQIGVTNVVSTRFEDCIEPIVGPEQGPLADDGPQFLDAGGTPGLPPDWTPGETCTLVGGGLECDSGITVMEYSGPSQFVLITFAASDAAVLFSISGTPNGVRPIDDGGRVALVGSIQNGSTIRADPLRGTISDLRITPITATNFTPPTNSRVLFDIPEAPSLGGDIRAGGLSYLASITLPTDGDYAFGTMCFDQVETGESGCEDLPSCRWFYDGEQFQSGGYEWDSSVDPFEENFPELEEIQRSTGVNTRQAGEYYVGCDAPARVFVRNYDDALVRSCNFVTWYFDLAQGEVPVSDLTVDALTPVVNDEELSVEAGARLTQDNVSRVTLLLDRSFSITAAEATESVVGAASSFVDSMPAGTIYQLAEFASEAEVPLDLMQIPSRDVAEVQANLTQYAPWPVSNSEGFTKLFDAIGNTPVEGFRRWRNNLTPVEYDRMPRTIVVFTDGDDTASTLFTDNAGVPDASVVTGQLDVCLTDLAAIGLGDEIQQSTLESLAGDQVFLAPANGDLEGAFQDVAARLTTRYRFKMLTPEYVDIEGSTALSASYEGEQATGLFTAPEGNCTEFEG